MNVPELNRAMARNAGVITTAEAHTLGLSRTMISDRATGRRWDRIAPRTYLDTGHRRTAETRIRIAAGATGGVVHGSSAAWWHGLLDRPGTAVEITVGRRRRRQAPDGVVIRRRDLATEDVTTVRGVNVTTVALSVIEAAVVLPKGSVFLDRMLQRGVRLDALLDAHRRNAGRRGAVAAEKLLTAAGDRAGSEAERILIRLLRRARLPGMECGYPTMGFEIDIAFPHARLAIEVDGWAWHHDAGRFTRDRSRQNTLVSAGWTVLRYTWHQLTGEPARIVAEITAALHRADR